MRKRKTLLFFFFFFSEKRRGEKILAKVFYLGVGGEVMESHDPPGESPTHSLVPSNTLISKTLSCFPSLSLPSTPLSKRITTSPKVKVDKSNF